MIVEIILGMLTVIVALFSGRLIYFIYAEKKEQNNQIVMIKKETIEKVNEVKTSVDDKMKNLIKELTKELKNEMKDKIESERFRTKADLEKIKGDVGMLNVKIDNFNSAFDKLNEQFDTLNQTVNDLTIVITNAITKFDSLIIPKEIIPKETKES